MATIKLLIHAPTPDSLKRAQSNARNLLKLERDAEVEIVVNGAAVVAAVEITDPEIRSRLVFCRNSLESQQLREPVGAKVVPAAVHYLACQQGSGCAYIRA
jgi:Uncharacterized conserved protein